MPQILVVTDTPSDDGSTVVYRERISATDLESTHFSGQLVERVGWAVSDASALERDQGRRLTVVGLPAPAQTSASQR
ncbi:MAG TPA: hypothetical protein VFJ57_04635 [Solirubrobacterales bacterium]|nr:hypothetical protein [Solirubrobacterales bacterium]